MQTRLILPGNPSASTPLQRQKPVMSAPTFGALSTLEKTSDKFSKRLDQSVFETYTPRPSKSLQTLVGLLNRYILLNPWLPLPKWKRISFQFDSPESKTILTQKIEKNAGVILLGAHPEVQDANILTEIHRQADHFPAGILFNSELFSQISSIIPPSLTAAIKFLLKPIFSRLGLMPVNRGAKNAHVKEYSIKSLNEGKWLSLFPEGRCNFTPRVSSMQKGAIEMVIQAAQKSSYERPIYLLPFAHAWTYSDPKQAEKELGKTLAKLETLISKQDGRRSHKTIAQDNLQERILQLGERILDFQQATHYLKKPLQWDQMNFYEKVTAFEQQGITSLEKKYGLTSNSNVNKPTHNRLMKIRTGAWEQIIALPPKQMLAKRKELDADLKHAQFLSLLSGFKPNDINDYGNGVRLDGEMLASYTRLLSFMMGIKNAGFGQRKATVKIMEPIDIRPMAKHYAALKTTEEKDAYAIELTKTLLEDPIQAEVNQLRQKHMLWKANS